ncbi:MAG: arsenate reductase (glutaredoxin) [Thermoanaerobaculia bacterium]|nr:arsenate reductase (glutaredoxin) [Thermoanaerobaculia bacterium]
MLKENEIPFEYREYTEDPLSEDELRELFSALGLEPAETLRTRDPVYRELGLTGNEPAEALIRWMALHPTLLQRPIGVVGERAVLGRPPERLLELIEA